MTVYYAITDQRGHITMCGPDDLPGTNETKISWNEEGPQGPAGPTGAEGPQGPQGAQGPAGPTSVVFYNGAGNIAPNTTQQMEFDIPVAGTPICPLWDVSDLSMRVISIQPAYAPQPPYGNGEFRGFIFVVQNPTGSSQTFNPGMLAVPAAQ